MCKPAFVTQFASPFIPTIHALALSMWVSDRAVEHLPQVGVWTADEVAAHVAHRADSIAPLPHSLAILAPMPWEETI
jgi:hypothetical protein